MLPPELIRYILKIKHRNYVKQYLTATLKFPKRILPVIEADELYYIYRLNVGPINLSYAIHKETNQVTFEFSNFRRHREYLRKLNPYYYCRIHIYQCEFCDRMMGHCNCETLFYCDCGHIIEYQVYQHRGYATSYHDLLLYTIYETSEEDYYTA